MDLPDFFGLDIGNHSIKAAEVDRTSMDKAKLVKVARIDSSGGVINSEDDNSKTKLAERIKELVNNSGIKTKKCVAALPESAIFTRLITVPKVEESKLEELVHWEARQYIPLPLSEVQKDYIVISEKKIQDQTMLQLFLIASPKSLVDRYSEIIKKAGLDLLALDTETVATARLLSFGEKVSGIFMVLDFGATGTDMSVIKNNKLIFSQSLSTGSDAFTKAISNDFGLEMAQAEQYKVAYGLDETQADGKIFKSIEPVISIVIDEISRTLNFFRTHLADSIPDKILLVGDGAKLLKLDEYITSKTGLKAELANPLKNLEIDKKILNEYKLEDLVGFIVSIGLGLKNS